MKKIDSKVSALVKEHGLLSIIQTLVENFDGQADFAHLSGDKKAENNYRKVAVILFDTLRKVDSV